MHYNGKERIIYIEVHGGWIEPSQHCVSGTRRGERVIVRGHEGLFAVLSVNHGLKTVDIRLIGRTGVVLRSIKWESPAVVGHI